MTTTRINLRLPRHAAEELSVIADKAGYASVCQLCRSVLVQFLNNREAVATAMSGHTEWMDEVSGDYLDPTQRRRVNERL